MDFISLFAGIGGLDLGLERAGHRCVAQVEWDPYCQAVLKKHWPDVPRWGDIREVAGDELPAADLIVGGFPCQPFSVAGKQQRENDPRHLWPEFNRLIRVLRPRYVLLENVPGLLAGGFGEVLGDLADGGYDAEWDCIPASAVGAPHLRYRVFVVAYANEQHSNNGGCGAGPVFGRRSATTHLSAGEMADAQREQLRVGARGVSGEAGAREGQAPERKRVRANAGDGGQAVADPDRGRLQECGQCDGGADESSVEASLRNDTDGRDPDASHPNRAGLGEQRRPLPVFAEHAAPQRRGWWLTEPDVGRVANGVPARVDRLRGLGNAVVPQVAEWIGRRLMEVDA